MCGGFHSFKVGFSGENTQNADPIDVRLVISEKSFRTLPQGRDLLIFCRAGIRSAIPADPSFCVSMLNLALVGEQRSRVRDLAGFRKLHRVPDEKSERSQAFVWRIAADDIGQDLDRRFADFRGELGLKRIQMKVSEPEGGRGTITTPSFQYQISVDLNCDDPSELVWRRCVSGFTAPEPVLSDSFSATFGTTFDTLEFIPAELIEVDAVIDCIEGQPHSPLESDYDRTATWCRLSVPEQMSSTLLIETGLVSLKSLTPCPPKVLLRSFVTYRELLPAIEWAG